MLIDSSKFKPKKRGESDKFSWNLYRFLKEYDGVDLSVIQIGWNCIVGECGIDQGETWLVLNRTEGCFMSGNRVNQIMCKPKTFAVGRLGDKHHSQIEKLDITERFFREYERNGRCAINDHFHDWIEINPNARKCSYCGKHERREIVTKRKIQRLASWV